ncbi:hypothetical protein Dimus_000211 [Dionaea muscipula]
MSSSPMDPDRRRHHHLSNFIQSATSNFVSLITPKSPPTPILSTSPFAFPSKLLLSIPLSASQITPLSRFLNPEAPPTDSSASPAAAPDSMASDKYALSPARFTGPTGLSKGGGPAFVGHVFTMCDRDSTSLMATYDDFHFPFLPERAAELAKKVFRALVKSDDHHIFRFFIDLSDAVSYVKRLNCPNGVVGACPLDLAYRYFKERSQHFQFIPNKKQVRAANKLLKELPIGGASRTVDGVPVFSAQNLDVVIASRDGINRYTPYFFNKEALDNILEDSVDRHFHSLIEFRHLQRQRDDNVTVEAMEEIEDDIWDSTEVEELMNEMVGPRVILGAVSKFAEMQLLHAVDKLLLGNRWLRKATGIQPKFPYVVDSFEKRSAASLLKASQSSKEIHGELTGHLESSKQDVEADSEATHGQQPDFRFPFGDWSKHPWSRQQDKQKHSTDSSSNCLKNDIQPSVLLPKITMVGIPDGEIGDMSSKKTMEKLKEELEQDSPFYDADNSYSSSYNQEHKQPLFVANVDDIYSDIGKVKFGSKGSRRKQLKKKKP